VDGGIVQPFRTTRENFALTNAISVNLKFVEVGVLLVAGILFVAWQFRDLQRAKEITRLKREAEKQANQRNEQVATPRAASPLQNDRL
jgi:hypothetical protein